MKVLSIGSDRKLFDKESEVLSRSLRYAGKMEELHILVFTQKKDSYKPVKINNLHIYPTNSSTQWLYISDAKKLGRKIVLENKFVRGGSVITTQDPFLAGLVGVSLSKRFDFPLQIQIHTDFLSKYFADSFRNRIYQFISYFTIPRAKGLRVVSSVIEESIKNRWKNIRARISVLPIFVDILKIINTSPVRDLRKDFPKFKFIIFMASRLTREKRFDVALETLKIVLSEYHHAGLVIAGEGPEKKNIERMAKKFGLRDKVALIGWQEDRISLYKTSNIFLLTSDYEGYGMTLIEAGASGAMIVTTKVGIAKTSLFVDEKNCHICPVGDPLCLSSCIVEVIRDNNKRELMQQKVEEDVKLTAVTNEEYTNKYVDLLKDLLVKV